MTCDLNLNEDQRQILAAASALLEASFPVSRPIGLDDKHMDEIAAFGGFGLSLDEEFGGAGFSLVEEALLHSLFGRHIVSTKALAAPLGARIAAEVGQNSLAKSIAAGTRAVSAAVPVGDKLRIIDPQQAAYAIVVHERRLELISLEGCAAHSIAGLGHSVEVAEVPAARTQRIGQSNNAVLIDIAGLLVSAQLLGIAEATRDLAVSYASVRRQFGRPIGAFQAIKHHCANMAIAAEVLSAQLDIAAIALRDRRDDAGFQTAAVRTLAPRAALANARICIQVHGGIGFSEEAQAHRYLKQAHILRQLVCGAPILSFASPMAPHEPR